ncbi:aminopeptidase N [Nocardioides sp. URHA0020]|uniref:aminopeptidase N n=1 Tax=Nocardioides sp. URHA0020 TaxID=1380392 RepID=UPI00048CD75D|nr:aminopeptidase N [Nocardioides sp. URHA0020]
MSLTLDEARARAAQLFEVAYDVALDLTEPASPTFGSRTTVRFRSSGSETFLELVAATGLTVLVNGELTPAAYDGGRVHLTALRTDAANEVVVVADLPYVSDGDGMHRTVDPADGATYVGAYLGMDVGQKVFACFDQYDLKAPIAMSVAADPAWTVLANGRPLGGTPTDGRWHFATTPPIPPSLVVVAAGPWASVRWEHAGLPFGWHARASLAGELARDVEELRRITEDCYDHFAELFDEPYAFDSYDQVFVPGLNWGAQEMPGCVTYRDELLPRGAVPGDLRDLRASVIAHEMSHMWFGDLMTMTWWEDTWLQESFADYMGYRVAGDAAGFPGSLVGHEVGRKPSAYDADQRRSTHPVAPVPEDVPDVDSAATIFDAISYSKGNSVLRQLATWLGDEAFLRGVNLHLTRHRFGNATLADLVDALDETTDRDVRTWVEQWLRTTGFDTLRVERDGDVPVLHRDGTRPHRVRVTAYDGLGVAVGSTLADVADEPVRLPVYAGLVVVPNSHGETFARIVLDDSSWSAVDAGLCRIEDDLVRAVLWAMVIDRVHTGSIGAAAFVDLAARHLPGERSAAIVTAVLTRALTRVLPLRAPGSSAPALLEQLAATCGTGLLHATSPELASAFADGFAAGSHDVETLAGWLRSDAVGSLPLTPRLRWRVVRRLAELGAYDAAEVEAERVRERGSDAELGAAAALAARPSVSAKESAWAELSSPAVGNRVFVALMTGLWSPEQPELLAPYVERYLREAPGWARRGQAFAQAVGQARPPLALTEDQAALLDDALTGDLHTVLRRQWEDWRDDLTATRPVS